MDSGDKVTLSPEKILSTVYMEKSKKYRNHDVGIYPNVQSWRITFSKP